MVFTRMSDPTALWSPSPNRALPALFRPHCDGSAVEVASTERGGCKVPPLQSVNSDLSAWLLMLATNEARPWPAERP